MFHHLTHGYPTGHRACNVQYAKWPTEPVMCNIESDSPIPPVQLGDQAQAQCPGLVLGQRAGDQRTPPRQQLAHHLGHRAEAVGFALLEAEWGFRIVICTKVNLYLPWSWHDAWRAGPIKLDFYFSFLDQGSVGPYPSGLDREVVCSCFWETCICL